MKVGLDTSVVLRLLTGEPGEQAQRALEEIQALIQRGASLLVSDLVAAEVYFALQHHYSVPKAEALSLLSNFLSDKYIKSIGAAKAVLAIPNLATARPGFIDRLIHAEYERSAKEMLSFEKAAGRLTRVRVLTSD